MSNKLREIEALGQAVWIDNLNRDLLDDGTMRDLIEQDGISGVTSNPTIFEKGMGHSDRYDDAFREVAAETSDPQEIFERLALRRRPRRRRPAAPDLRRDRGPGRLRLLRAAGLACLRCPRARSTQAQRLRERSIATTC